MYTIENQNISAWVVLVHKSMVTAPLSVWFFFKFFFGLSKKAFPFLRNVTFKKCQVYFELLNHTFICWQLDIIVQICWFMCDQINAYCILLDVNVCFNLSTERSSSLSEGTGKNGNTGWLYITFGLEVGTVI